MFELRKQSTTAFAKVGVLGKKGSGKSVLVACLAAWLSKTYHNCAPVALTDTEDAADFALPIFQAERIGLYVEASSSLADMRTAPRRALEKGCCAWIGDSVSKPWQEAIKAIKLANHTKRLSVNMIGQLKEEHEPFVEDFRDLPIHCFASGRLGYEWERAEYEDSDEDGNLKIGNELVKGDTKMKTEAEFSHEPDLVIETSQIIDPDAMQWEKFKGRARKKMAYGALYVAVVKKSRIWGANNRSCSWKGQTAYTKGYCDKVAEPFLPFFNSLAIGQKHQGIDRSRTSVEIFQNGNPSSYREALLKKTAALEDWYATMDMILPGRTDEGKRQRMLITEGITGVRSKSRFESFDFSQLLECVGWLLSFEHRVKQEGWPLPVKDVKDADLIKQLELAKEDFRNVLNGAKDMTLLEAMLHKSVEKVNGAGGQQVAEAF